MSDTTQLIALAADGRSSLLAAPRISVLAGPDAGARCLAATGRVVIGTDPRAQVVLHDPTVSRFHCELVVEAERVSLRDLGSKNGTRVNGVQVVLAYLEPGARLTLGRSELLYELGAEQATVPLSAGERFGELVGRALITRAAFALLERAAASDATLLLGGETGTGKEAAAEAVHGASARRGGPLVVVDCAAIPPQLMESELFGHEKGAFTGAVEARDGAFQAARGGTIFLDEVGELPLDLQPKLLRALERRQVKRVGAAEHTPADVRIIAATNRDLKTEVNEHRFRADLYYRLAVLEVRLPALRERREDLPLLVEHLLGVLGAAHAPEAELLRTPEARAQMERHPWPGNVRELRNHVERCLAFRAPPALAASAEGQPAGGALKAARERNKTSFEREYLERLLADSGDNVSAAARSAGVDRKYLYRLLYRHGLR